MRRRTRLLIASYALLLTLVGGTRMASATFWGGSWPYNHNSNSQQLLYLPYGDYTGGDTNISSLVGGAAQEWVNAAAPPDLYNSSSYVFYLDLNGYIPDGTSYGYTFINNGNAANQNCGSPCGGPAFTTAHITFSTSRMDSCTSACRQSIVAHEMGHVIGLGHADGTNCYSLMVHLVNSAPSPAPYDVYDENLLYPNTHYPLTPAC